MKNRYRDGRHEAQGAGRGKAAAKGVCFRPKVTAPEAQLALLRGIWGKRDLLEKSERDIVWSFLQQAKGRALSEKQVEIAKRIGLSVGVGYDDPALDDEPVVGALKSVKVQPWGPLPLKPPGR